MSAPFDINSNAPRPKPGITRSQGKALPDESQHQPKDETDGIRHQ
jgi:hypothetical protein